MESKKWYQSKTIWGIIIAAIGYFLSAKLGVSGVAIPESPDFDKIEMYYEQVKAADGNFGAIIGVIMNAIGLIVAIIGRIKAETLLK